MPLYQVRALIVTSAAPEPAYTPYRLSRSKRAPAVETVLDRVVAPVMYRILFRPDGLDAAYARRLVTGLLDSSDR